MQSSKPHFDKAELRKLKKAQTAALDDEYIRLSDRRIAEKLIKMPEYQNASTVFAYYSVEREVDTQSIIDRVLKDGKVLALPRCEDNRSMSFRLVVSRDELKAGAFGIMEPSEKAPELVPAADDIIIVPALCCDEEGNRLGHGAGYYDRYLEKHGGITVCLCRKKLLEKEIPTEKTDIKVSKVLTE